MPTTITINSVSKHYTAFGGVGQGITKAVDNISLSIDSGELFFLLGPSGCGKTTLLRMIAGFIEPTSGRILFDGRDVTRLAPAKRNTGMVFQSYALWPHMTVFANVAFGLGVRKIPRKQREPLVMDALRMVRMDQYARRKPNQLSGGQQQRVALARALVIRPDVLLLDEPLSNLDAKLRLEMRSEIRRICKQTGITTIYVTHDQKEALSMADRIAVLDMGIIAQVGPPRELYERPATRFVAGFLGETNFIEDAEIISIDGPVARIRTPAGELLSSVFDPSSIRPGAKVALSIRPETLMLDPPLDAAPAAPDTDRFSVLRGRIAETIYLGEMAQHIFDLDRPAPSTGAPPAAARLKVFELHPRAARAPGSAVTLAIRAADVVILAR